MAKDKLDKIIDETEKLINKKETNKMGTKLTEKTIKVSTLILITVALAIGIVIGIYSTNTVNSVIKHETQSQVKSFTSK